MLLADPQTGKISSQSPEVETGLCLLSPMRERMLLFSFAVIPRESTYYLLASPNERDDLS